LVKARGRGTRAASRARIVEATLETLERVGFAATTARAIAETGGFNQALIYYHFENLEALLAAAVTDFSGRRIARYRAALAGITSVAELVETMTTLYREDATTGHLAAAQEVVAGSSSSPELARKVVELVDPWFAFAEETVERLLAGTLFGELIPTRELAYALVALYFGVETLARLDRDHGKAEALFESGARLAPLVDLIIHSDVQLGDGS
jgi:AcrR family transcriptional regulator